MRYTGDPVAGDAGVPAMRDLNRKRVVATAFVAAHLVAVSFESTGAQDSESANCVTTCQALYSGSVAPDRSEEHTSELQSHSELVCRLLLEKKKPGIIIIYAH